ncbi:hypothetical protein NUSPORA_01528 [Nucleospora cyclopteri]
MKSYYEQKYKELESAIFSKKFPIVVYGCSGYGKASLIKTVLKENNLNFINIDITSIEEIKKPLKPTIFIVEIFDFHQLKQIQYRNNVILHCNFYFNTKNCNYKLINISKNLKSHTLLENYAKKNIIKIYRKLGINYYEDECNVDIFRLLGRIFNKKIYGKTIECDNNNLYYNILNYKNDYIPKSDNYECHRINFIDESSNEIDLDYVSSHTIIFSNCKLTQMIYSNFLNFSDISNISIFYDLLSLCDLNIKDTLPALIIALNSNSKTVKKFVSFKSDKDIIYNYSSYTHTNDFI